VVLARARWSGVLPAPRGWLDLTCRGATILAAVVAIVALLGERVEITIPALLVGVTVRRAAVAGDIVADVANLTESGIGNAVAAALR
jgi:hypothetical protein